MYDAIIQSIIPMDQSGLRMFWCDLRQPCHKPFHLFDLLGLRGAILLRPALDLPRYIPFRPAEIAKPQRCRIEAVQPCDRLIERIEERPSLRCRQSRRMRLPEYPALHMLHQIERRSDDAAVFAQDEGPRYRKIAAVKRRRHPIFPFDRMSRGQERSR